jgi:subtilase family serine protease
MRSPLSWVARAGTAVGITGCAVALAVTTTPHAAAHAAQPAVVHRAAHTCAIARRGYMSCNAIVRLAATGRPASGTAPAGLGPAELGSAYQLAGTAAAGRTVAVVDAFHDPTAARDLAKYRSTFHLPRCTVASGCFRQVDQDGGSSYPATDAGWATEISLDLDMVSAACPSCSILLVEANAASASSLASAVDYAASQHVAAISNSYGGPDTKQTKAYDHPGIAVVASTGDDGYGIAAPASYGSVIAVGGTSLTRSSTTDGWTETAWDGAGSGCSQRNAKPTWQTAATHCTGKATADVAAVADPYTGVAVYDTTPYQGAAGWQVYGGTSAAAPIVAAIYALSGNTAGYPAEYTWAHAGALDDITTGSNGSCTPAIWCKAGAGWDGPTGLGSPRGVGAF